MSIVIVIIMVIVVVIIMIIIVIITYTHTLMDKHTLIHAHTHTLIDRRISSRKISRASAVSASGLFREAPLRFRRRD